MEARGFTRRCPMCGDIFPSNKMWEIWQEPKSETNRLPDAIVCGECCDNHTDILNLFLDKKIVWRDVIEAISVAR